MHDGKQQWAIKISKNGTRDIDDDRVITPALLPSISAGVLFPVFYISGEL